MFFFINVTNFKVNNLVIYFKIGVKVKTNVFNKAVSDGGVFNIRSLIHLVTLQLLYRHTHRHTDTQSL